MKKGAVCGLTQVNTVDTESLKALLARLFAIFGRAVNAFHIYLFVHNESEFRSKENLIALPSAFEPFGQDL